MKNHPMKGGVIPQTYAGVICLSVGLTRGLVYKMLLVIASYPSCGEKGVSALIASIRELIGEYILHVSAVEKFGGAAEAVLELRKLPHSLDVGWAGPPTWKVIDNEALDEIIESGADWTARLREVRKRNAEMVSEYKVGRAKLTFENAEDTSDHCLEDGSRVILSRSPCLSSTVISKPHFLIMYKESRPRESESAYFSGFGGPSPRASFNIEAPYNAKILDDSLKSGWLEVTRWIVAEKERCVLYGTLYLVWLTCGDIALMDFAEFFESSKSGGPAPIAMLPSPTEPCAVYIRQMHMWRTRKDGSRVWEKDADNAVEWIYSPYDLSYSSVDILNCGMSGLSGVNEVSLRWVADPPKKASWYRLSDRTMFYTLPF